MTQITISAAEDGERELLVDDVHEQTISQDDPVVLDIDPSGVNISFEE